MHFRRGTRLRLNASTDFFPGLGGGISRRIRPTMMCSAARVGGETSGIGCVVRRVGDRDPAIFPLLHLLRGVRSAHRSSRW